LPLPVIEGTNDSLNNLPDLENQMEAAGEEALDE